MAVFGLFFLGSCWPAGWESAWNALKVNEMLASHKSLAWERLFGGNSNHRGYAASEMCEGSSDFVSVEVSRLRCGTSSLAQDEQEKPHNAITRKYRRASHVCGASQARCGDHNLSRDSRCATRNAQRSRSARPERSASEPLSQENPPVGNAPVGIVTAGRVLPLVSLNGAYL